MPTPPSPLLQVTDLKVHFPARGSFLGMAHPVVRAVDGVSFDLAAGETLGLVGESGCGKTTIGRAVVRLLTPTAGRILFDGTDLVPLSERRLRPLRRQFQMVFQDPFGSLDPRMTVEATLGEALDIHQLCSTPAARRNRIAALLSDVGLEPAHAGRYPHEFSGGQRQRIGIARALAVEPRLIVCDEPVSALDVSVQAQIVNLLVDLQQRHGFSYLFVAHDLAVVKHISHRILVMYLGRIVESGDARTLCRDPLHPYTRALISAVPAINPPAPRSRVALTGDLPSPVQPPTGCAFHPRCPLAEARCRSEPPRLRTIGDQRSVACHLVP